VVAHERLIGNDLVASVDRILNGVSARRQTELAALAGGTTVRGGVQSASCSDDWIHTAHRSDGNELSRAHTAFARSGQYLLSRFPFDCVKIDSQFVSQVDTGGAGLIKAIVSVANYFG